MERSDAESKSESESGELAICLRFVHNYNYILRTFASDSRVLHSYCMSNEVLFKELRQAKGTETQSLRRGASMRHAVQVESGVSDIRFNSFSWFTGRSRFNFVVRCIFRISRFEL